jgi:hypothetical protein
MIFDFSRQMIADMTGVGGHERGDRVSAYGKPKEP